MSSETPCGWARPQGSSLASPHVVLCHPMSRCVTPCHPREDASASSDGKIKTLGVLFLQRGSFRPGSPALCRRSGWEAAPLLILPDLASFSIHEELRVKQTASPDPCSAWLSGPRSSCMGFLLTSPALRNAVSVYSLTHLYFFPI